MAFKNRPNRAEAKKPKDPDHWRPYFLAATVLLIVARVFVPSEPASAGEGIPFVQYWLLLSLAWVAVRLRRQRDPLALGGVELLLLVLTAWYIVCGIIGAARGSPRPVINSVWEWIGIVVAFLLIRQLIKTPAECRAIVLVMIGVAAGLAIYGLYQHYVEFPALRVAFSKDPERLLREAGVYFRPHGREATLFRDRLRSSEPLATFALTNSLAGFLLPWLLITVGLLLAHRDNVPRPALGWTKGLGSTLLSAVRYFRRRHLDLCAAGAAPAKSPASARSESLPRSIPLTKVPPTGRGFLLRLLRKGLHISGVLVLLWTLVLTKSRGAILAGGVGLLAIVVQVWTGIGITGAREKIAPVRRFRKWRTWLIGGVASLGFLLVILLVGYLAGWDRQVILEAPKSLGYRLQYWYSTFQMIREYPVFGCGPGNFQIWYTRYMLPEASEEISDPHNFLLETTATAGIPGGLLLALALAAYFFPARVKKGVERFEGVDVRESLGDRSGYLPREISAPSPSDLVKATRPHIADNSVRGTVAVFLGAFTGVALAWPLGLLSSVPPSAWAVFFCLATLALTAWAGGPWVSGGVLPTALLRIAAAALLLHLCVSGGITFANVAGSLWLLIAVGLVLQQPSSEDASKLEASLPPAKRTSKAEKVSRPEPVAGSRKLSPAGLARRVFRLLCGEGKHRFEYIGGWISLGSIAAACLTCYLTAYRPVLAARSLLAQAQRLGATVPPDSVMELLRQAAEVDPLSAECQLALALTYHSLWLTTDSAVWEGPFKQSARRFVQLSGPSAKAWELLGDWYWEAAGQWGQGHLLEQSAEAWSAACRLFPTNASLHAKLARALFRLGRSQEAQQHAARALELDRLTPHRDRKLSAELREDLEQLLQQSAPLS
jgi:O-antigen ligase